MSLILLTNILEQFVTQESEYNKKLLTKYCFTVCLIHFQAIRTKF